MIGIQSANIASALISQTRAAMAPAPAGRANAAAGANPPALIVDVSGGVKREPEGYDLFKIKRNESLLDKQIEIATELGESEGAFAAALESGNTSQIVSEAYKLNGLLKAESALADAVEDANQDDAKRDVDALELDGKEAVKDLIDDAADGADEAKDAESSGDDVDLDAIAEEAEAAAEKERAEAAAAAA